MQVWMVYLWRQRITLGERNFVDQNQRSNILRSSFSNSNIVRMLIQFRRERQIQHLER